MPKKPKSLTDNYLRYIFPDEEYSDEAPAWLTEIGFMIGYITPDSIQPMVYTMYDSEGHPLYTGKTIRLYDRMAWHIRAADRREPWMQDVAYIGLILCGDLFEMDLIEVIEIAKKQPKYNRDLLRDDKNYTIIAFTPEDEPQIKVQTYYKEDVFPFDKLFD